MTDFRNLPVNYQAAVQSKLDGYIEACILLARAHNIGLSEAIALTVRAVLRELSAHKISRERANEIWVAAATELQPMSDTNQISILQ